MKRTVICKDIVSTVQMDTGIVIVNASVQLSVPKIYVINRMEYVLIVVYRTGMEKHVIVSI